MRAASSIKTPKQYVDSLAEPRRREIARIDALIRATLPKLEPFVHAGMLGYGRFRYRYASGREGDWFKIGLASQKRYISLYACGVVDGVYVAERYKKELGKANVGRSCIRFRSLDDLHLPTLRKVLRAAAKGTFGM